MPVKESTVAAKAADMTNINMLNTIRNAAVRSISYQDRIPVATQTNLSDIYSQLLSVDALRNEFISALVLRIGITWINSRIFQNPLRGVKSSAMPYGAYEQEMFVNMAKGQALNFRAGYEALYAIYESEVMAAYHKINFQEQYPVTISFDELRNAFTSAYGIRDLLRAKVDSLYSGANYDEYLVTLQLCDNAYDQGLIYPVTVSAITDETSAKAFLTQARAAIRRFAFPHPEYTIAGATSFSTPEEIIMITTPEVEANVDVQAIAYAFNQGRAEVKVETIVVDHFENDQIQAIICDARWFRVRDNFRTFTEGYNAAALSWNYFYNVSELFSVSPFMPCIAFTTESSSVTGLASVTLDGTAITASTTKYTPGKQYRLGVTVNGTGYVPKTVKYTMTGAESPDTVIVPGSNILIVGADESGSLVITATSLADDTKKVTAPAITEA